MEGSNIDDPEMRGITPRVVDTVFEMIDESPPYLDFTLKVSMVEIYLEKLRDLIDTFHDNLEVRLGGGGGATLLGVLRQCAAAVLCTHPVISWPSPARSRPPHFVNPLLDSGAQGLRHLRGGLERTLCYDARSGVRQDPPGV
jgi:hypothetical protein